MNAWVVVLIMVSVVLVLLASIFLRFTLVKEGTAKAVMRLDGFRKIIMKWEGKLLNKDWDVVNESNADAISEPWYHIGGLRFVGIRFIDKPYKYKFRWRDVQLVKGEDKVTFHEENIDYIFVRPDVYFTDIKEVETKPPERIPINVQFLVTARSSNPHKTLFKSPSNWLENAMSRLNALLRGWLADHTLDEILNFKSSPKLIWEGLPARPGRPAEPGIKDNPLLLTTFKEWGTIIEENGIEIRDIELPAEYQKAAALEKRMQLTSKGFSAATTGRLIAMIADLNGVSYQDVQNEFSGKKADGTDATNKATALADALNKYKEVINMNQDLIKRKLGLGSGQLEIFTQSPEGFLAALAKLWRGDVGGGSDGTQNSGGVGRTNRENKPVNRGKETRKPGEFLSEDEY